MLVVNWKPAATAQIYSADLLHNRGNKFGIAFPGGNLDPDQPLALGASPAGRRGITCVVLERLRGAGGAPRVSRGFVDLY